MSVSNELKKIVNESELKIERKVEVGSNLFHYTNVIALYNIFESSKLWISKSDYLNDSTELIYINEILFNSLEQFKVKQVHDLEFLKLFDAIEDEMESLNLDIFILSLTENNDSITLWSGYSNNDGYCLGFDSFSLITEIINMKLVPWFGRVNYNINNQVEIIVSEIDFFNTLWDKYRASDDREYIKKKMIHKFVMYSMFFKQQGFSHEEEYRIAFLFNKPGSAGSLKSKITSDPKFRIKNGAIIPYIELELNQLPLTDITIGPKNNLDISAKGLEQYLESKNYKNIHIKKSSIPLRY